MNVLTWGGDIVSLESSIRHDLFTNDNPPLLPAATTNRAWIPISDVPFGGTILKAAGLAVPRLRHSALSIRENQRIAGTSVTGNNPDAADFPRP